MHALVLQSCTVTGALKDHNKYTWMRIKPSTNGTLCFCAHLLQTRTGSTITQIQNLAISKMTHHLPTMRIQRSTNLTRFLFHPLPAHGSSKGRQRLKQHSNGSFTTLILPALQKYSSGSRHLQSQTKHQNPVATQHFLRHMDETSGYI